MSCTIDLTQTDAANKAMAHAANVAHKAARYAEQMASDAENASRNAPPHKKQRTDNHTHGDEEERERFRKHAEEIAHAHFVKDAETIELEGDDDGEYTVHIEDCEFETDNEGVGDALQEHFGDCLPDAANDIASMYDAEVTEPDMFFGSTAMHIQLKIVVNDGTMKIVGARVPTVTEPQYHAIRAMMDDYQ